MNDDSQNVIIHTGTAPQIHNVAWQASHMAVEQEKNNTNTAGRKTSQHFSKEQCKYNGNG